MIMEDMFNLLYETLGGQDMFLLEKTWTVVQNYRELKNLDGIDAYSRLVKFFITTYKKMKNARPNALSLARKVPKVASRNKVKKVKDEDLKLVSKSMLKSIQEK